MPNTTSRSSSSSCVEPSRRPEAAMHTQQTQTGPDWWLIASASTRDCATPWSQLWKIMARHGCPEYLIFVTSKWYHRAAQGIWKRIYNAPYRRREAGRRRRGTSARRRRGTSTHHFLHQRCRRLTSPSVQSCPTCRLFASVIFLYVIDASVARSTCPMVNWIQFGSNFSSWHM